MALSDEKVPYMALEIFYICTLSIFIQCYFTRMIVHQHKLLKKQNCIISRGWIESLRIVLNYIRHTQVFLDLQTLLLSLQLFINWLNFPANFPSTSSTITLSELVQYRRCSSMSNLSLFHQATDIIIIIIIIIITILSVPGSQN